MRCYGQSGWLPLLDGRCCARRDGCGNGGIRAGQGRGAAKKALNSSIRTCCGCAPIRTICRSPTTKGEGFENKLAELFAAKLGKKLAYTFFPQATGFVRMTLGSHRCDVIMGYPQGDDMVQNTNPYYQTAYALVTKTRRSAQRRHDAGRSAPAR